MAVSTLADGRAELQARGYSRFAAARLTVWLNAAKNRFEDYFDWPWNRAFPTGVIHGSSITNLRRILSVTDATTRQVLDGATMQQVLTFGDGTLTLTGTPSVWYLDESGFFKVYPVSTSTFTVVCQQFSPELSADGDAPLIPLRYRSVWVDLAEVDLLRYGAKDAATANSIEAEVFRRLKEIATVYAMQDQQAYSEQVMTGASVDG